MYHLLNESTVHPPFFRGTNCCGKTWLFRFKANCLQQGVVLLGVVYMPHQSLQARFFNSEVLKNCTDGGFFRSPSCPRRRSVRKNRNTRSRLERVSDSCACSCHFHWWIFIERCTNLSWQISCLMIVHPSISDWERHAATRIWNSVHCVPQDNSHCNVFPWAGAWSS